MTRADASSADFKRFAGNCREQVFAKYATLMWRPASNANRTRLIVVSDAILSFRLRRRHAVHFSITRMVEVALAGARPSIRLRTEWSIKSRSQNARSAATHSRSYSSQSHRSYYVFMTVLIDSGCVPQKNFPFNNFRTIDLLFTSQAFGRKPNALLTLCNCLRVKGFGSPG